jgi:hypothetical protein
MAGMYCPCCGEPHLSDTARCPSCGCRWREPLQFPPPGSELVAELRRIREAIDRVGLPVVLRGTIEPGPRA